MCRIFFYQCGWLEIYCMVLCEVPLPWSSRFRQIQLKVRMVSGSWYMAIHFTRGNTVQLWHYTSQGATQISYDNTLHKKTHSAAMAIHFIQLSYVSTLHKGHTAQLWQYTSQGPHSSTMAIHFTRGHAIQLCLSTSQWST
jgi:hypothetical protein